MFKVRVIPCLDVKDGRVVKGIKFLELRDAGDPVAAAIAYDSAGIAQLEELDSLDHAPVLDVEAGNDADFEHQDLCWRAARMSRKASLASSRPS